MKEVHKMNEEAISYIMQKMSNCLDNSQMISLEKTLEEALRGEDRVSLKPSEELLEEFLSVNMLRKMGEQCEVDHVHPHKFRRTMATTAIDRGMPIEQVQKLLGHEKIDTTLHYAMVKQSNVKLAHKKYMG